MSIIDRRLNPRDKGLSNRQRFIKRHKDTFKKALDELIRSNSVAKRGGGVKVPIHGTKEPSFGLDRKTGKGQIVVPGNKEFNEGDTIPRPDEDGGGGGSQGAPDGEGQDAYQFILSRQEFLDLFFEDLELPDLVRKQISDIEQFTMRRAGYTNQGSPAQLDIKRTLKNSMGRRIGLKRPKQEEIDDLDQQIQDLMSEINPDEVELQGLLEQLEILKRRNKAIPWLDPFDVRYRLFQKYPQPIARAVMFCLMDVSGSMSERHKDIAKRFFILLHIFLERRYPKVEVVWIRHTQVAREVDEQTFFTDSDTGGTVVSSGLDLLVEIQKKRYPTDQWNIYVAQASDGDNFEADSPNCVKAVGEILKVAQFMAYLEIASARGLFTSSKTELWSTYEPLAEEGRFALKNVSDASEIWTVFRELFKKDAHGKE